MKYNYSKAVITGVLALALATGGTVMADNIRAEQDIDNKVSLVTTDDGKTEETEDAEAASLQPGDQSQQDSGEGTADDSTALDDALQALRNARNDERLQKLEEELKGYVDAGSITQEQADLILTNEKEHGTKDMKRNKGALTHDDQMMDPSAPNWQGKRQRMRGKQSQNPQGQMPQGKDLQNWDLQNRDLQNQNPQNQKPQNQQPQNQNPQGQRPQYQDLQNQDPESQILQGQQSQSL